MSASEKRSCCSARSSGAGASASEPLGLRSVTISGYYGHKNTGDDALAATIAWGVASYLQPRIINMACDQPLVLPQGVNARFIEPSSWSRHRNWWRKVSAACHVIGGGSVLHDRHGLGPLAKRLLLLYLGRILGCRTAAIGVSIGPITHRRSRGLLGRMLRSMAFVGVRDQRSLEFARSLGPRSAQPVSLMMDPAVLLDTIGLPEPMLPARPAGPILVVAPCDWHRIACGDEGPDQTRRERLTKCLDLVRRQLNCHIRLLVMNGSPDIGDEVSCRSIAESLSPGSVEVVPYNPNPLFAFRVIQQADLVLGMRLHSLIFAYAAAVPFIALNYHQKVADFVREVAGPDSTVFHDTEFDPAGLADAVSEAMRSPAAGLAGRLALPEAHRRVRAGFERLAMCLADAGLGPATPASTGAAGQDGRSPPRADSHGS